MVTSIVLLPLVSTTISPEVTVTLAPPPLSVCKSQSYVPGMEATVAHLFDLVKYHSAAAAVPSTALKSGANTGSAAVPVELGAI